MRTARNFNRVDAVEIDAPFDQPEVLATGGFAHQ
jgi:hypothetical protein